MASTALVTFVFDCPAAVRTVELLGSWDNFSKSYQLKRDRRRGPSIWWGCYTFQDIICDGDLDDLGFKRNGALKMGGTYWYYYKVDGDDEHHNPTEPSTTVCPLLPGQRLNVLDVPIEESTQTTPYSSDVFTRNPEDKYLTPVPPAPPVPPKPYPSPGLGSMFKEPFSVSAHHLRTSRSATYPSTEKLLSPGPQRHVRSASTTPSLSSTPLFADFKSLKEKLAAKRSAASTKELQIGAPTLVSHTNEDLDLVPLGSFQFPSRSSPMPSPRPSPRGVPQTSPSPQLPNFSRLLGRFSPLGSHPVDSKDTSISPSISPTDTSEIKEQYIKRPRSHIPSTIVMSEFKLGPVRARANSADTRRTRHYLFSNEPWLSSPIQEVKYELDDESLPEVVEAPEPPAPVLKRPSISLVSPMERPTSSYGGDRNSELRTSPLDKELPALPRYLVPAPLFACSSAEPSPTMLEEPLTESPAELEAEEPEAFNNPIRSPVRSHFSVWSTGSFSSPTSPASDNDEVHSPTFSSLTSTCSDVETPQRLSTHFTQEEGHSFDETEISINVEEHNDASNPRDTLPPQLDQLHLSGFGPNLFNLDIQLNDSGPRRHATCFGLDFKGYSLPEDETTSKTTITESFLQPDEPAVAVNRRSSVSHFSKLMNEFGYLGESVV